MAHETAAVIAALAGDRKALDDNAKAYMKLCYDYLADENNKMRRNITNKVDEAKLMERIDKLNWINDVIDLGNTTRLAAWKAQALQGSADSQRRHAGFRENREETGRHQSRNDPGSQPASNRGLSHTAPRVATRPP